MTAVEVQSNGSGGMTQYKSNKVYPWLIVAAYFIVNFGSIGYTMASAGVYLVPQSMDLGTDPGTLSWWLTLYGFGMAFVLLFTDKLWARFDPRFLVTVGFAGQMIAVTLMGTYTALWQFYASGICIGLFGGLYYMIGGPFLANRWFVKKTGLAIGIMWCGTAVGGIVNPLLLAMFIEQFGWRMTQIGYGIALLAIIIPTALIILRADPSKKGMKPYGWTPEYEAEMLAKSANPESLPGVTFKRAIRSVAFWCVFIFAVASCFFGGFNNYYPAFVQAWGFTPAFGALLVSLGGICNFVGPLTGAISDKVGAMKITLGIVVIIGIGWLGWCFCGPDTSEAVIIAVMFLTSCQMLLTQVQLPLCVKEVFGLKDYERIWSTMMIGVGALSSFAAPIIGAPFAATGTYFLSFVIGIIVALIALVTLLGMYGFGKKLEWEK